MLRSRFAFLLFTAVSAAAPAAAQEAAGQDANAAPAWAVLCTPGAKADGAASPPAEASAPGAAAEAAACVVRQRLVAAGDKRQVLLIGLLPKLAGAVLRLQLPLGLDLATPVALDVDGAALLSASISTCTQAGCFSLSDLDEPKIAALKAGKTLNVKVKGAGGRVLSLPVTLRGFSKAFVEAATRGKAG